MAHDESGFLKRAIGISAVLHLLVAPLFVTAPLFLGSGRSATSGAFALDKESLVTRLAIEHRPKKRRHAALQIARAPLKAQPDLQPHKQIVAPRVRHDAPAAGVAAAGSQVRSDAPRLARAEGAPAALKPAPGSPQPANEAAGAIVPTPAPTPSPMPTVEAVAAAMTQKAAPDRGTDAAAGGWGQNFDSPMLTDDSALADLKSRYHVSGIAVKVDENGRAVRVIVPPNVPAAARDEIVQRLGALHYVPAECNGLRCAGTMTVTL